MPMGFLVPAGLLEVSPPENSDDSSCRLLLSTNLDIFLFLTEIV